MECPISILTAHTLELLPFIGIMASEDRYVTISNVLIIFEERRNLSKSAQLEKHRLRVPIGEHRAQRRRRACDPGVQEA